MSVPVCTSSLLDQVGDEAAQLGRILDPVLRLAGDGADDAGPAGQADQHLGVQQLEVGACASSSRCQEYFDGTICSAAIRRVLRSWAVLRNSR